MITPQGRVIRPHDREPLAFGSLAPWRHPAGNAAKFWTDRGIVSRIRVSSLNRHSVKLASQPVISCYQLTKRFGTVAAVNALSLEVAKGTICAFLGPNGAGKSTTVKMLSGLLAPTSG